MAAVPNRRWRLRAALLASLTVHLLLIFAYQRWGGAERMQEILRPVELTPRVPQVERFRPETAAVLPRVVMEQLAGRAEEDEVSAEFELERMERSEVELLQALPGFDLATKRRGFVQKYEVDSLALDDSGLETLRRQIAERERFQVMALPDADTTDAETRNRRRAEAIVDRAIETMGGVRRLRAIRDRVDSHDSRADVWVPGAKRYYKEGRLFREDVQREVFRGFDGEQSWHYRFGLMVQGADLREEAERWDFLSRYKGREILLAYGGREEFRGRTMEVVGVTDLKYGTLWLAYFDVHDHLLRVVREGGVWTEYLEYKEVSDVLMPFEIRAGAEVHRLYSSLNSGLKTSLFLAPKPRTWEPEMVVLMLQDGAEQIDRSLELALNVAEMYQWPPPDPETPNALVVDDLSLQLLNTYLFRKLEAADVMRPNGADYQVDLIIDGYYVTGFPQLIYTMMQPIYTMMLSMTISDGPSTLWQHHTSHRWRPTESPTINDRIADDITSGIVTAIGRARSNLKQAERDSAAQ